MSATITTINKAQKVSPKTPLYGLLYNWYAANDARGIAPTGWHIPFESEFSTLITALGSDYKTRYYNIREIGTSHWAYAFAGVTNSSGLTVLPAGSRTISTGAYVDKGLSAKLMSGSINLGSSYCIWVGEENSIFFQSGYSMGIGNGESLRCIRDSSTGWTEGETVLDYDGNLYHTVQIGTQIWMVENLAVTHYKNGDIIPEVTDNTTWTSLTTGALCAYNNDWTEVFK